MLLRPIDLPITLFDGLNRIVAIFAITCLQLARRVCWPLHAARAGH
nr:MAG TPA: hypothetical protein [Caudoviricetes sp.]